MERPFTEVGDAAGEVAAGFIAGVNDGFDVEVWKGIADENFEVLGDDKSMPHPTGCRAVWGEKRLTCGNPSNVSSFPYMRSDRLAQSV